MMPATLAEAIEAIGPGDPGQRELIQRLLEQLNRHLAPERQLWDCCPHGGDCWRPSVSKPARMHYRVPFVGPGYPRRRIVIVGMNTRDDGGIAEHFIGMRAIMEALRSGRRTYGRSRFHYRAGCATAILAANQDGVTPIVNPPPQELVDPILASARIMAVQCAPAHGRRSPTSQMWANCPPMVMADQLEILEPRVVALLGQQTHASVQTLERFEVHWDTYWRDNERCFARGSAMIGGRRIPLLALSHPASSRWSRSLEVLTESLAKRPLTAT